MDDDPHFFRDLTIILTFCAVLWLIWQALLLAWAACARIAIVTKRCVGLFVRIDIGFMWREDEPCNGTRGYSRLPSVQGRTPPRLISTSSRLTNSTPRPIAVTNEAGGTVPEPQTIAIVTPSNPVESVTNIAHNPATGIAHAAQAASKAGSARRRDNRRCVPTGMKHREKTLRMPVASQTESNTLIVHYYQTSGPALSSPPRPEYPWAASASMGDTYVNHVSGGAKQVWYRDAPKSGSAQPEWKYADGATQFFPGTYPVHAQENLRLVLNVRKDGFATWIQYRTAKGYERTDRRRAADFIMGFVAGIFHRGQTTSTA